jgi:poly(3-hydroxybutyrate) depolymerase
MSALQAPDPFNQPEQIPLGIEEVRGAHGPIRVCIETILDLPFCTLRAYRNPGCRTESPALVVPPLSGHYPIMFRDLVLGLLEGRDVFVAEWKSARHVPLDRGSFAFEDNIGYIANMIEAIGTRVNVIGICQSAVPCISATCLISQMGSSPAPQSLILIGGPVDVLANPTAVVERLRERPPEWFVRNVIQEVPEGWAGEGRLVYPAHIQLSGLLAYLTRHVVEGGELSAKLSDDDGSAPEAYPFISLYSTVMDLPAELFLDNIETVYHRRRLICGGIRYGGEILAPQSIEDTGLMTIEGEVDDISAPGQTYAAHYVCRRIPDAKRASLLVPDAGHFSLFCGRVFRKIVLPQINRFIAAVSQELP